MTLELPTVYFGGHVSHLLPLNMPLHVHSHGAGLSTVAIDTVLPATQSVLMSQGLHEDGVTSVPDTSPLFVCCFPAEG